MPPLPITALMPNRSMTWAWYGSSRLLVHDPQPQSEAVQTERADPEPGPTPQRLGQVPLQQHVKDIPVGEHVSLTSSPMHPSLDVPAVLKVVDLVVEGQVERAVSAITANQQFVATTYDFRVDRVLFNHEPPMRIPGPGVSALRFTHAGGQVEIDGRVMDAVDLTLRPFPVGAQLILFLKRDTSTQGTFVIVDGPYGAFSVQDGRVRSFLQSDDTMKRLYDGTDLAAFRTLVQAHSRPVR